MTFTPPNSHSSSTSAASDGWVDDSTATWTFATAATFTVTGDRTAIFTKGTRLRFTQTTVKYATVAASSHAAGTTTVTIFVNTDYVLANAAISVNSYSYEASPAGYPGYFAFDCAPAGWAATPTQTTSAFYVVGNKCVVDIAITGTSNAATATVTLPVNSLQTLLVPASVQDVGAGFTGRAAIVAASPTITFGKDATVGGGFTASGVKQAFVGAAFRF